MLTNAQRTVIRGSTPARHSESHVVFHCSPNAMSEARTRICFSDIDGTIMHDPTIRDRVSAQRCACGQGP